MTIQVDVLDKQKKHLLTINNIEMEFIAGEWKNTQMIFSERVKKRSTAYYMKWGNLQDKIKVPRILRKRDCLAFGKHQLAVWILPTKKRPGDSQGAGSVRRRTGVRFRRRPRRS